MKEYDPELTDKLFIYLGGYAAGAISILGVIGNILSLIVLTRPEMRGSNSNIYLIVLAIYDILYLVISFVITSVDWIVYGLDPASLFNLVFTVPGAVVLDPILYILNTGSVYTTVSLTIDRCIAVAKPLQWSSICTKFRIKVTLVLVFFWSVLINSPFFAEFTLENVYLHSVGGTYLMPRDTEYSLSTFHKKIFLRYLFPITEFVIPVVSILTCNIIIIVIVVIKRNRKIVSTQSTSDRTKDANRLTAQVLFISGMTLVSRSLHAAAYVLMASEGVSFVNLCSLKCGILSVASLVVVRINATINFICYCYFGKKFRSMFRATFPCLRCQGCPKIKKGRTPAQITTSQSAGRDSSQSNKSGSLQTVSSYVNTTLPTTNAQSVDK